MKIAIFTKSYVFKASFLFILILSIISMPAQADASFFGDLVASVMGNNANAQVSNNTDNTNTNSDNTDPTPADPTVDPGTFGTDDFSNSQNVQVLETSSIDPDNKNANNNKDINISEDGSLTPSGNTVGVGLESVSNGQETTYTVQEGDTLSEIAQQFDISTNTIKWANNISGNTIQIGQKLTILPVTGVKHIVKSGDTLSGIANKYEADVNDIMVFNDVSSSSQLKVGQILYVPNGVLKSESTSKSTSSKSTSYPSSSTKVSISGYFIRPASGPITSPYGPRKGGFHYGVDIGVPRGSRVSAAASGTVVEIVNYCREGQISCGGRYGNYIMIEHSNGLISRYAHLSKVYVSVGQKVSQGDKIGASGNTGHSTGPHVHFQIEKPNGSTIRPVF